MIPNTDLGPSLRLATWMLVALSAIFLNTRLACKYIRHRTLHLDDWVLAASWVALLGAVICTTIEIGFGFGQHAFVLLHKDTFTTATIDAISLTGQIAITFGICAQAWSKTSWAITLLRISPAKGPIRPFMWFALVSMNVFFAGPAFGYWLQCRPLRKAWQPSVEGTCWSPEVGIVMGIVASAYSGIMDLLLAALPWLLLRSLHVSAAEKMGIAVAMSMGVFAAVSAFIKASVMPSAAQPDFSFAGVPLTLWSVAEPAVTIMAASVPMMRVLVQTVCKPVVDGDDVSES